MKDGGVTEERGGAEDETLSLPLEGRLCPGMTSGMVAGITSGATCDEGVGEEVGVKLAPNLDTTA